MTAIKVAQKRETAEKLTLKPPTKRYKTVPKRPVTKSITRVVTAVCLTALS